MGNKLLSKIRKELKKNVDLEYKEGEQRYFKEKIKSYGVRALVVRKISRKYFKDIKNLKKEQIFSICEKLLKSGYTAEITIACDWAYCLRYQYNKKDFIIFESWLKKYIYNWGNCDDFCGHALGSFIFQFPEFLPKIKKWTKSKNRWLRRASAVTLIYSVRKEKYLKNVFETADTLLLDKDDLVQKGYGWMLKEASNVYPKEVFNYVMKNKNKMPRTALRYAVEKFPDNLRKKAIKK